MSCQSPSADSNGVLIVGSFATFLEALSILALDRGQIVPTKMLYTLMMPIKQSCMTRYPVMFWGRYLTAIPAPILPAEC